MEERTYNTYGTIPKAIRQNRRNSAIIDISNTHMDDRALVGLAHVWQWKVAELSFHYGEKAPRLL